MINRIEYFLLLFQRLLSILVLGDQKQMYKCTSSSYTVSTYFSTTKIQLRLYLYQNWKQFAAEIQKLEYKNANYIFLKIYL